MPRKLSELALCARLGRYGLGAGSCRLKALALQIDAQKDEGRDHEDRDQNTKRNLAFNTRGLLVVALWHEGASSREHSTALTPRRSAWRMTGLCNDRRLKGFLCSIAGSIREKS